MLRSPPNFSGSLPASSFPLLGPADTVTAPNYSWTAAPNTGLFMTTTSRLGFAVGGIYGGSWASGGPIVISTGSYFFGNSTAQNATLDTNISRLGAASLAFGNGTNGNTTASLSFGKVASINATATSGVTGVAAVVATGRVTAQAAANANISSFTVGAADGSFEVSGNMNVTASTALATTITVTYTDESNTSRTMVLPIIQLTGTFVAAGAITGTGAWESPVMHIRCKGATTITIGTTAGTFTGVTYTAEGIIKQTA